ncbi:hypothetical protein [uncultured Methanobrevibacter sp.]|uniref:hypothetical protein n=1 Tax=uncultured Methanobrevibacter sp. TaxID=253161 RepID=UPI0025E266BE|nr:hypothetical protein [uncultured Methanobrevibacter sp.]
MRMVYFPNVELELYEYTDSLTEFNSYYEPLREYTLKETVPCNFQPMTPNDSLKEFGEILTDTYKAIIDSNVEVNPRMLVKVKGEPDTYEITGTPMVNTHFTPTRHTKLVLKKQRKPTKVITDD